MCTKKCKICEIEKPCDEFHKMKKGLFGVRTTCKECRKIEKQDYNAREYVKQKNKKYYLEHKDEIRERTNKHRLTLNGQFHEYKKSAKKRNIEFELVQEQCEPFFNTNCYYCGDKFTGLGMDRINNSIGYKLNNIVPCCYRCNIMKHTSTEHDFIKHIEKILTNLKIKNGNYKR